MDVDGGDADPRMHPTQFTIPLARSLEASGHAQAQAQAQARRPDAAMQASRPMAHQHMQTCRHAGTGRSSPRLCLIFTLKHQSTTGNEAGLRAAARSPVPPRAVDACMQRRVCSHALARSAVCMVKDRRPYCVESGERGGTDLVVKTRRSKSRSRSRPDQLACASRAVRQCIQHALILILVVSTSPPPARRCRCRWWPALFSSSSSSSSLCLCLRLRVAAGPRLLGARMHHRDSFQRPIR